MIHMFFLLRIIKNFILNVNFNLILNGMLADLLNYECMRLISHIFVD